MINEPDYGFCAGKGTSNEDLAKALEFVRRRICEYNLGGCRPSLPTSDSRCDCKYGADIDKITSLHGYFNKGEQTGCPELRETIYKLLHKEEL